MKKYSKHSIMDIRIIDGELYRQYGKNWHETDWVNPEGRIYIDSKGRERRASKYEILPRFIFRLMDRINPIWLLCFLLAASAFIAGVFVNICIDVMPDTSVWGFIVYALTIGSLCMFGYYCKIFYDEVVWDWLYDRRELRRDQTKAYRERLKAMSRYRACEVGNYPGDDKPVVVLTDNYETDYLLVYLDGRVIYRKPVKYTIGRLFQGGCGSVRVVTDCGAWCITANGLATGVFDPEEEILPNCPEASRSRSDYTIIWGQHSLAVMEESNIRLVAASDDGTDTVIEINGERRFKSSAYRYAARKKGSTVPAWLKRAERISFRGNTLVLQFGEKGEVMRREIPLDR